MNAHHILISPRRLGRLLAGCSVCCFFAAALPSCSNIDEDERLTIIDRTVRIDSTATTPDAADSLYQLPYAPAPANILIEDHTGQSCPNCPDGTSIINQIVLANGNRIVPVAIHSEMQGIMEPEGLGTALGNTYYQHWNIEFKPAALVNRMDFGGMRVLDKTVWSMAVSYVLTNVTADAPNLRIVARQSDSNPQQADIKVKVLTAPATAASSGQLQVWITEDDITALQDQNGTIIRDYTHNHVLRAAVNGDWGEAINWGGADASRELHYTATLQPGWNTKNLGIVAFVYNDDGVVQVDKTKLTTKQ
ncbi:MAG: Omp28 family outer membrane lipoprotein [Prevotella sp.]|nr:Omp28 family outer membrane lipoprotein [Prevotella sp.]